MAWLLPDGGPLSVPAADTLLLDCCGGFIVAFGGVGAGISGLGRIAGGVAMAEVATPLTPGAGGTTISVTEWARGPTDNGRPR